MRKIVLLLTIVMGLLAGTTAQVNIHGGLEDVYRNFMVQSHSQFSKTVLNGFAGLGGEDRFMSRDWLPGGATNNFGVTISANYLFNYDFLAQELHAKWRDTTIVVNTNYVSKFFLVSNNSSHQFVKSPELDPQGKYFYESVAYNEETGDSGKIQLLKLRTVKQLKANKNDYLANFNGEYSDKMDNEIQYFIVLPNKSATRVKLNKRSVSEALKDYKSKVDGYFSNSKGSFNESEAANLIRFLNQ